MAGDEFDLLLKGGRVIDPVNGVNGSRDVGIAEGKIAAVEAGIAGEKAAHVVER